MACEGSSSPVFGHDAALRLQPPGGARGDPAQHRPKGAARRARFQPARARRRRSRAGRRHRLDESERERLGDRNEQVPSQARLLADAAGEEDVRDADRSDRLDLPELRRDTIARDSALVMTFSREPAVSKQETAIP